MNYLVVLDVQAGELEKILSGVKTMLVKEIDPGHADVTTPDAGDSLYFLRDRDDCAVRVKATVVRTLSLHDPVDPGLSHALKEHQSRLRLTEDQYLVWSARHHVHLVEFESARKTGVIYVAPGWIADRSEWTAFEDVNLIRASDRSIEK
jgi:hypothetical protein